MPRHAREINRHNGVYRRHPRIVSRPHQTLRRQLVGPGAALDDAYQEPQGVSEDPRGARLCGINHLDSHTTLQAPQRLRPGRQVGWQAGTLGNGRHSPLKLACHPVSSPPRTQRCPEYPRPTPTYSTWVPGLGSDMVVHHANSSGELHHLPPVCRPPSSILHPPYSIRLFSPLFSSYSTTSKAIVGAFPSTSLACPSLSLHPRSIAGRPKQHYSLSAPALRSYLLPCRRRHHLSVSALTSP